MFIEGGRAWEIELNIDRLETEWLGEVPSKVLAWGQELLDDGSIWTAPERPRKKSTLSVGVPPGVPLHRINGLTNGVKHVISDGVIHEMSNGLTNGVASGLANGMH
ncbi:hypothetical protein PITC_084380 [Penicillium italicum]|uniref:Uncharacterized protein n=1 Tax=Penicillium italicum TaxID=40296 RepID=A0A0A2L4X4_PENIT|nr:hypothetical protein PITC_084380 [Penicillium italicum]